MWNDSIAMLNYGFQNIEPVTVVEKGSKAAAVPVRGGSKKMVDLVAEDSVVLPKCKQTGINTMLNMMFRIP
jgi:D-alanyl-D-alanine carboxypeptidase (penicillin-binding protein 5/6)